MGSGVLGILSPCRLGGPRRLSVDQGKKGASAAAVQLPKAKPKHRQLPDSLHAWGKHPRLGLGLGQELDQPPHLICLSQGSPQGQAGRLLKPQTQQ